jgi:hypothetical protein
MNNNQTFLEVQAAELRRLLEQAESDPILAPQLQERLDEIKGKIEGAKWEPGSLLPKKAFFLPRAAIFLGGGGVNDSQGIRPTLAGEVLVQYEKMFTEQALHDEREAAKKLGRQRRPRGAPTPELLFTGTLYGSFGLEFSPHTKGDESLLEVHAQALVNVANALVLVAANQSEPLSEIVQKIPPRVLPPLKQFMNTLAQHGAEVRLAFPDGPSRSLSIDQVKNAAERLEKEIKQETVEIPGVFRGVTRESGIFDLKIDAGDVITGTVADNLTEEDLERIDLLTNSPCIATIQRTIVSQITGAEIPGYVLIDAKPTTPNPARLGGQ